MKTVIAGGYGTRISEESHLRPKPMVEVGGMPLLWHIMKIYSSFGLTTSSFVGWVRYRVFYELSPSHVGCHRELQNGTLKLTVIC